MHKQRRPSQRQYEMLETFMTNVILMIFFRLKAMLTDRLRRKSTSKKKKSSKSLVQDIRCRCHEYCYYLQKRE